jgi:hypothetical protein
MGCGASSSGQVAAIDQAEAPTTGSEAAGISQRLIREHTSASEKITDTYELSDREDWILGSGATSTGKAAPLRSNEVVCHHFLDICLECGHLQHYNFSDKFH